MITVPKRVEYSLVFISYLSENKGKNVSLTEAAKKLVLPYRFLGQIAADLKTAGIVESKEGKAGGYVLSSGWDKRSVFDLLEALGEMKTMVKCAGCKRDGGCRVKMVFDKIEAKFLDQLRELKLDEIKL